MKQTDITKTTDISALATQSTTDCAVQVLDELALAMENTAYMLAGEIHARKVAHAMLISKVITDFARSLESEPKLQKKAPKKPERASVFQS
ncbi:hypothetical protein [Thalassococcus lentus]|uniref:Uncharacterized protein n=1 Tax=Thalassococcus lentus TaxID=1210524 RepID=A0ABT4XQJ6_9RHOB|nr:hypothetical protein [Thalassococcus lentus]MDA7424223.1 hypothetical protein [Thalassococcus lentus]